MAKQNSPNCPEKKDPCATGQNPRWNKAQPRIYGAATFEWNAVEGTTWFSPEWAAITQSDDYDWTRPNDDDWWTLRVHPNDMPVLQRACLAILAGFVEASEATFRMRRPDGSWRWILSKSQVTERTAEGAPFLISGMAVDLTDAVSEKQLRVTSSVADVDYHSMLENSPDLFIRLTRELAPVYVNPAINRYLGRSAEDQAYTVTEKDIRISGDYLSRLRDGVERVFAERAVVRQSLTFSLSNGAVVIGEASLWPEFDEEGEVNYAMAQFRDLTEHHKAEQRAMLNEQRLEALYRLTCMENASESEVLNFVMDSILKLTNSRSGFIFIPEEEDSDKGYLLWSEDHYTYLDRHHLPEDYLPEDLLIQMTDAAGKRCYRSINNGDGITPLYVVFDRKMRVMRGITAPGREGNRMVCVAGVCNKDSDYEESDLQQLETFISSAWLILRRRRFVSELQKAKEAAEAANKAKDAFLANISHELRTPLNGVLSMIQLIEGAPLDEQQREYLQTAQDSGKALLRIISDLLDFSCMESGKMPLALDLFEYKESVLSALSVFEGQAGKKGLRFACRMDPDIPRYLVGDEARVRQIIFNLVGNSLKFTHEGGISVACSMLPESLPGKAGVSLTVSDTGIGIAPEKLAGIFEAFSQMESAHRRKYSGTGLGLGIVKHLTAMMGGKVSVESELGRGTTVTCVLFFDLPDPARISLAASPKEPETAFVPALDILVAEDDRVSSLALRAFLQREGHKVVCVEDGRQALEALQLYPFHCVFTDIEMPHLNGIEVVRRIRAGNADQYPPSEDVRSRIKGVFPDVSGEIRAVNPEATVIAVSAHTMIGDKERFLRQGMNHYISKPIIREELRAALAFAARRQKYGKSGA